MKALICAASALLFVVPAAQAACSVDLVGTWSVTHTSERLGAPRVKEDMPSAFSFSRDSLDVSLPFMSAQSPYTCSGKTITVYKTMPWVLEIVSSSMRELAWKDQNSGRIFYLKRS